MNPGPARRSTYRVAYSKSFLEFAVPAGMQVRVAEAKPARPLRDTRHAVTQALDHPVGSAPLSQLAKAGQRVCIVFTDSTRACPDHLLVPALLGELKQAGVRDRDITLLCGRGLHRPSTLKEWSAKLGKAVVGRYAIIDHTPQDPSCLADLGFLPGGEPIRIHHAAVEADLLISTGVVEPHQFAGYSGGAKTLAVGAAGEALIAHTHGPAFLDHPRARLGCIEGNPFHEAVVEITRRAGLRFIINVVLDHKERLLRVSAGDPETAFLDLVDFARSIYETPIPNPVDLVIGGVGYPKDVNLYQTSRAASYLCLSSTPLVRQGGLLIIPGRCQDGAGTGPGEQRFLAAMRDAPDVQSILERARRHGYPPGEQRAFILAQVLEGTRVVIVASECPEVVSACKMIPAPTMEEALALASRELGPDCRVLIVPHALLTIPVVRQAAC